MAKIPLLSQVAPASIAASTTNTLVIADGSGTGGAPTTEASQQITFRKAGVLSNIWIRILTNDRAASTFTSRKNAGAGAQTVTIGASTTGEFQDTTNTDAVTAGDEWNARLVTGAGGTTFTVGARGTLFSATTNTTTILYSGSGNALSTASSTTFSVIAGAYGAGNATEADTQHSFRTAGTLDNFQVNVRTNGRSTTSTARVRVNGANGNEVISIGAGVTGILEDTTNSDTIASGDEVAISTVLGTGTGSLRYYGTTLNFTTTNNKAPIISGQSVGTAFLAATTYYPQWGHYAITDTVEANLSNQLNVPVVTSNLACYVSANTVTLNSTLRLRKNAANGNQVITVTASTTGYFEDTTNTDSFIATDEIGLQLVGGATGTSHRFQDISVLGNFGYYKSPLRFIQAINRASTY